MVINGSPKIASFTRSPLDAELSAMHAIAVALEPIADEDIRARVLHWAAERFSRSAFAAPAVARPAALSATGRDDSPDALALSAPLPDDTLSMSAVAEMFIVRKPRLEPEQSTGGMLQQFVAEFQDVVQEWNAVCSEPDAEPSAKT